MYAPLKSPDLLKDVCLQLAQIISSKLRPLSKPPTASFSKHTDTTEGGLTIAPFFFTELLCAAA